MRAERAKSKTKRGIRRLSLAMAGRLPDTTGQLLPILRLASLEEPTEAIVVRNRSRSRANPKLCQPPLFSWSVWRPAELEIQAQEKGARADPGVAPAA